MRADGADEAPAGRLVRSLLFVPGDSPAKLQKALASEADGIIADLEDAVAPSRKHEARATVAALLSGHPSARARIFVRINGLRTDHWRADLEVIVPHAPVGIVLPKACGAEDVRCLSRCLDEMELAHGASAKPSHILAIVTEDARSVLALDLSMSGLPRLWGLMWGAEDLGADLGATSMRDAEGGWTDTARWARAACLFAARAAGVRAVDAVQPDFHDLAAVREEARVARRDGFDAKALIHPAQAEPVNAEFTPTAEELQWATRVLQAFSSSSQGVAHLDGRMIDRPHLKLARKLLSMA